MRIRPHALINPDMWATWNYVTGTDADTTMVTNSLYIVNMAAWAAADRSYTLPASPNVNDLVGIDIQGGNASFELIIKTSAAVEITRLFITDESYFLRYTGTRWTVEADGRIAQKALLRLSTNATGETAATLTQPTAKGGVWTADIDNASITTVASDQIKTRRAGTFTCVANGISVSNVTDANYFNINITKNGTANTILTDQIVQGATALGRARCMQTFPLATDDFLQYVWRSQEGAKGLLSSATALITALSLTEIL